MLTTGMERSLCEVQSIVSPSGDPQVENHCFNASSTGHAALLVSGVGSSTGVSSAASRKKTGSPPRSSSSAGGGTSCHLPSPMLQFWPS